jgi:hypothetical protein
MLKGERVEQGAASRKLSRVLGLGHGPQTPAKQNAGARKVPIKTASSELVLYITTNFR